MKTENVTISITLGRKCDATDSPDNWIWSRIVSDGLKPNIERGDVTIKTVKVVSASSANVPVAREDLPDVTYKALYEVELGNVQAMCAARNEANNKLADITKQYDDLRNTHQAVLNKLQVAFELVKNAEPTFNLPPAGVIKWQANRERLTGGNPIDRVMSIANDMNASAAQRQQAVKWLADRARNAPES